MTVGERTSPAAAAAVAGTSEVQRTPSAGQTSKIETAAAVVAAVVAAVAEPDILEKKERRTTLVVQRSAAGPGQTSHPSRQRWRVTASHPKVGTRSGPLREIHRKTRRARGRGSTRVGGRSSGMLKEEGTTPLLAAAAAVVAAAEVVFVEPRDLLRSSLVKVLVKEEGVE